ncbi:outer membrane beta-barrel protein [Archangium violaceum]|uniref:Membrane protein n=1 Tax=Archangium violaceum Cb vi76 TaxID=1406225 RepID=A0A084ST72_9BACT|nr:outer membrane beta-barrel protein [Archangium violaceum]KFA91657.1 membrane protein [Archangium violaceum Cb vi76]
MNPAPLTSLLTSLLLGQTTPAGPPAPPPAPPAEEEAAPSALEALVSRLKVEGGVDVYYGYNFNRPADGASFIPGTGTTAKRDNEISLNLASLGVSLEPAPVGFRVLVGLGTSMEVVHAAEPEGTAIGPDVWRLLQQATLSYAHGPLLLEAGVYPSHIGLESFQTQLNWTYTRSWMGELSPYYQTGLKGTWTFSEAWSAQLHLLNGWQTIGENNRGKALGTQVAYAGERLSAAFNTFIGEEGSGDAAGLRLFADVVATYEVTDTFSLAATADVGTQRRPGLDAALWYGAGLNARVQVARPVAVAARAEFYNDRDGLISGTAQRLVEGTLTLEVKPAEHLVLKLEARHDRSTADVFGGAETNAEGTPVPRSTQTLVVAGATAWF